MLLGVLLKIILTEESYMPTYDVYYFCDACGQPHPSGIRLGMDDPNLDRRSIGDVYAGRDLPPEVVIMANNLIQCPNTGNMVLQRDNQQVFLVAVAE